jgi:hypothetical protein
VGVFSSQKYFKIISKSLQKVVDKSEKMCYIIVTPNERELNKMANYKKLVKYFEGCGFNHNEATKEVEGMIKYHTTGVDAVSREYAIDMMCDDLGL